MMYFLHDGEFKCYCVSSSDDDNDNSEKVGEKKEKEVLLFEKYYRKKGDYFGELALLFDQPRSATLVSTTDNSILYGLRKETVLKYISSPIYDTAKKIILQKYSSNQFWREIVFTGKIRLDELRDLFKAKLQPKKKAVS